MPTKVVKLVLLALILGGFFVMAKTSSAQSNPTPAPLGRPDYNYSESDGCTRCHFVRGPGGAHMPEAVGVVFDSAVNAWKFTGGGWRASVHSSTNYMSTQNTFCAKCHSPMQAAAKAAFKNGQFKNTDPIPDGKVEGVTCGACHPNGASAAILGRRLGQYQWGMDRTKPEAYKVVEHGKEDELCLSCHVSRHNEQNPAFASMYNAGVRCIDCHMAPYDLVTGTHVEKRFHDFKVAKNLPFSCGVQGSMIHCHPGFSAEGTLAFIPYLKDQHKGWWPMKKGNRTQSLSNGSDYMALWLQLDAQARKQ